ncbi:MAG: DUF3784 domain-containing protein [Cryomorphaceae bacterium]
MNGVNSSMGYAVALFLAVLGWAIDRFKLYGLIAGYNNLPPEEKANINIDAVARLIRNTFFLIALILVSLQYFRESLELGVSISMIQALVVVIGVVVMILKANGEAYRN